jgi:hypothetical protein
VSITKITAEELARQHLAGKSISELSHQTGKGEWAIRKQIQRYRHQQDILQQEEQQQKTTAELADKETPDAISPVKESPLKKIMIMLGVLGTMAATYFLYMKI